MGGSHPHPTQSNVVTGTPGYRSTGGGPPPTITTTSPSHYQKNAFPSRNSPLSRHHKKKFASNDSLNRGTSPTRANPTTNSKGGGAGAGGGGAGGTTSNSRGPIGTGGASRPKLRGAGANLQVDDATTTAGNDATPRTRHRHQLMRVTSELHHDDEDVLFDYVANSVVGKDLVLNGPFGQRKVLYLDYIASGKPLTFIEEYITKEVLPTYANTHTTTSTTARQTTIFRNEARAIIHRTTNASDDDVVIFTGNGVTGAIHKVLHALNFTEPPVVFVGPYEHHSNILPWREMHAEVIRIGQTSDGLVDQDHLEEELKKWSGSGRRLVGSFSAASNVTGILVDTVAISILLHRHGALTLWDYATAAPYVKLDMNPEVDGEYKELAYKDVIFISPHKFVGGPDTPGVLIAKKHIFINDVPHHCGGGTVLVVRQTGHRYLQNLEEREEGGTPSIVGAIRAGLVFQLKEAITPERIMRREQELFQSARDYWRNVPNLIVLGNTGVERLPVFSFLIHHPTTGFYLHHNFVACLLNDLFGIQARGGCACAGPYAMDLLGITEDIAEGIEQLLIAETKEDREKKSVPQHKFGDSRREIFKPGFTRLNLPYFLREDQVDFVLQAVAMVAEHGWKLLPQYKFNPQTGEWKHELSQEGKQQRHLEQLSYGHGFLEVQLPKASLREASLPQSLHDCLQEARLIISEAEKNVSTLPDQSHLFEDFAQSSRWFLLPSEASEVLHAFSQIRDVRPAIPFVVPNQNSPVPSPNISISREGVWRARGEAGGEGRPPNQQYPAHILDAANSGSPGGGSHGSRVTVTSLGSPQLSARQGGNGGGVGGKTVVSREKKSPSPVHVRKIKVNGYQPPEEQHPPGAPRSSSDPFPTSTTSSSSSSSSSSSPTRTAPAQMWKY